MAAGYVQAVQKRDSKGYMGEMDYIIFDEKQPFPGNPDTDESIENKGSHPRPENPDTDSPYTESQDALIKLNNNKTKTNKKAAAKGIAQPSNQDLNKNKNESAAALFSNLDFSVESNLNDHPEKIGERLSEQQYANLLKKVDGIENLPAEYRDLAVTQLAKHILSKQHFSDMHALGFRAKLNTVIKSFRTGHAPQMMREEITLKPCEKTIESHQKLHDLKQELSTKQQMLNGHLCRSDETQRKLVESECYEINQKIEVLKAQLKVLESERLVFKNLNNKNDTKNNKDV